MIARIVLLIFLIFLNAVFASAEIAVLKMGDTRLKRLDLQGNKAAKRLLRLTKQPARFLSTIQVAITFAGFLSSAFAADGFSEPLVKFLKNVGLSSIPDGALEIIVIILITVILGYVSLVFGELVPKRVAMVNSDKIALGLSGLLNFVSIIFKPLVSCLTFSTNAILKLMGIDPSEIEDQISEEDILMLIDEGTEKGTIESSENELIQNVFEFNDRTVEDVCTHRTDVVLLYMEDDEEEWKKIIYSNRFSHYPICGDNNDDIIGILDTKDYFRSKDKSRDHIMKNAVDKVFFVSQNMKASDLFKLMQAERNYYSVAIDEYGGMIGIVTLHDLIEALVGEIQEEDELPEPDPIVKIGENLWNILGIADIEDVEKALGLDLELEDVDTFGGYILGIMGRVPDDGSSFKLETDELSIDVTCIKGHRIGETVVRKKLPEDINSKEKEGRKDSTNKEDNRA